jgi:hypothetical protein
LSFLDRSTEQVRAQISVVVNNAKKAAFGTNNERLDFLMDSFYKLEPQQRNLVLTGIVGTIAFFVLMSVGLYFGQLNSLKSELNNSFKALHELHVLEAEHDKEKKRFDSLLSAIERKNNTLKLKPFFEQIAIQETVQLEGLSEQKVQFPSDSPFATKLEQNSVEMNFPKISIPRLLSFLIESEKAGHYLTLDDLQIRSRYGTKLHFTASAKIKSYRVTK